MVMIANARVEQLKVGDFISQKLSVSDDKCWDQGTVRYIFNDNRALIYEDKKEKDVFILNDGREFYLWAEK